MWVRDEYLARERVTEHEREAKEYALVRSLLHGDRPAPRTAVLDGRSGRRTIALAIAASARAAIWLARRIDSTVDFEPSARARAANTSRPEPLG